LDLLLAHAGAHRGEHHLTHLRARVLVREQVAQVGHPGGLGTDARADLGRGRGQGGLVRRLFVGVQEAERVENGLLDEGLGVHRDASSPVRSRSRTRARESADLMVPSGMSISSLICRSVWPPRYA